MLSLNDDELKFYLYLAEGKNISEAMALTDLSRYDVTHLIMKTTIEVEDRRKLRLKKEKYDARLEKAKLKGHGAPYHNK